MGDGELRVIATQSIREDFAKLLGDEYGDSISHLDVHRLTDSKLNRAGSKANCNSIDAM